MFNATNAFITSLSVFGFGFALYVDERPQGPVLAGCFFMIGFITFIKWVFEDGQH